MARVVDVANTLIEYGWVDKSNGYHPRRVMDNLRLQKHLFFAQIGYIEKYGEKLFEDEMEAWQFGPVVRDIYGKLHFIKSPLQCEEWIGEETNLTLDRTELYVILNVMEDLKDYMDWEVMLMSLNHPLWIEAWETGNKIDFEQLKGEGNR